MAKRTEVIRRETVDSLLRHHSYLTLFQKEDWRDYLLLIAQIYDLLDETSQRVPIESVRSIAMKFFAERDLMSTEMKVSSFLSMMIGELQVFKDSHDQFGQRYIEATRSGQRLLQLMESLLSERSKFSGTGAEALLGALNDILVSRREMSEPEAIEHHQAKIKAYREDMSRIREFGITGAELLPLAHSNEALFSQAENAAIDVLQAIEDVKVAIEEQRKDLAEGYFKNHRSAGQTLSAVADFYRELHASSQYESYVQTKELFSHLDSFQTRFSQRNVDRLLASILDRDLIADFKIRRSPLKAFMRQFGVSDTSIQEKVKAQLNLLQQQVLYAISTDVEGLQPSLHALQAHFNARPELVFEFLTESVIDLEVRDDLRTGAVQIFDFELPFAAEPVGVWMESIDLAQERDLFLALIRAEEGTLKEFLARLRNFLDRNEILVASTYGFPGGLAEYYVLSEIDLFDVSIEKTDGPATDIRIESRYGFILLREAPAFTLRLKNSEAHE